MPFEFDPNKSQTNREKPGIDCEEAQALWNDGDCLEIPVRTLDEPPYPVIERSAANTGWR